MTTDTAVPVRHMTQAEVKEIASGLLAEHGLSDWSVRLDNAVRRAGRCVYTTRLILISRRVMEARTYEGTLDTIRHEVAHALTPYHGHDKVWAETYAELGGTGKRVASEDTFVKPIESRYLGHCTKCSEVFRRHRVPPRRTSCHLCNNKRFDMNCLIEYVDQKTGRTIQFDESGRRV